MPFLRLLILVVGFTSFCTAAEFRVVSWNIQWFPGMRPGASEEVVQQHITDVQNAIAELKPDILVLQEIKNWEAAEAAVAGDPGLNIQIASRFPGSQQQIIATRFPVDSGWAALWDRTGTNDPPRGYAFAVVRLPSDQSVFVYTFHFKANSSGAMAANIAKREEAARQMLAHSEEMAKLYPGGNSYPVIFAGDFNTDSTDPRFAGEDTITSIIGRGFTWVFDGLPLPQRTTLPASGRFPDANFDHILFRGLRLKSVDVPTDYDHCSDHRPIVAVFETEEAALAQ